MRKGHANFFFVRNKKIKKKCSSDRRIESVCEQRIKYNYGEKKEKKCRFSS